MWDEEYSVDEHVYGESPNDFLLEMTASLKKGNALCLAEGEGRNAAHLARHGFSATAVDSSLAGLNKADKRGQKHGVTMPIENIENGVVSARGLDCPNSTHLLDIKPAILFEKGSENTLESLLVDVVATAPPPLKATLGRKKS